MKRMLYIALLLPSCVCAMQPEKKEVPQLKLNTKDKVYLGIQGAAIAHDVLRTTMIVPFSYGLPMTVVASAAIIGGDMLYNSYQNYYKANNLENNK
jgi:hypothetical protein